MTRTLTLASMMLAACGGQTVSDGGVDGPNDSTMAPDFGTTGCGMFNTQMFVVDASACTAQLESATSCSGAVCSWTALQPCTAGDAGDAGSDCMAICNALKPTGTQVNGFCQSFPADGGTAFSCGGCGI